MTERMLQRERQLFGCDPLKAKVKPSHIFFIRFAIQEKTDNGNNDKYAKCDK
jgi:hypothetical protein